MEEEDDEEEGEEEEGISLPYGGITTWLKRLGMERFINNFVQEEIDMDVLPHLTEEHLKKIGVETIGARLCICAAIEKLKPPKEHQVSKSEEVFEEQLVNISRSLECTAKTLTKLSNNLATSIMIRAT